MIFHAHIAKSDAACPLYWALLGIQWRNMYYLDIAIPFGVRIGAMACSRKSQLCHIMHNEGVCTLPYIDDFAGVQTDYATALKGFTRLRNLFTELNWCLVRPGIKLFRPRQPPWIGIEIDTMTMEMRMPKQKICYVLVLVNDWGSKICCTKRQLKQLLSKLFHIAQCVKPARIFLGCIC